MSKVVSYNGDKVDLPNLNKTHQHKDNAECLMYHSGTEINDPNIVCVRNGKVEKVSKEGGYY